MKNQKGITLMVLVITIVVMALIAGSISYNSISSYRLNAYYAMCSDIELLDEKIALYYLENKSLPIEGQMKTIDSLITDMSNVNYNPNNSGMLYKIDLTQLDNLTLQITDYYIDEQSHTIYAARGKKIGDEIYYTVPTNYQEVNLEKYR